MIDPWIGSPNRSLPHAIDHSATRTEYDPLAPYATCLLPLNVHVSYSGAHTVSEKRIPLTVNELAVVVVPLDVEVVGDVGVV